MSATRDDISPLMFIRDSKGATRPTPIFLGDNFSINENWRHQKGAVCFDRKIDKDLYPILKNPKM